MIATMDRPVVIPFRWLGHGLDLRVVVQDGVAWFSIDDVLAMIDRPGEGYPLDPTIVPGVEFPVITADEVRELDADRASWMPVSTFIAWFEDELLAQLQPHRIGDLTNPDPSHGHDSDTVSIAEAARILSRDRFIAIGERDLRTRLQELEWIHRDGDNWEPTDTARKAGHLTRRRVRVPVRGEYYQVRMTPLGLSALHRALGGRGELTTPTAALADEPFLLEMP